MVSNVDGFSPETVPGLRTNTLADGLFHAVTYIFTVLGVAFSGARSALASGGPRPSRRVN